MNETFKVIRTITLQTSVIQNANTNTDVIKQVLSNNLHARIIQRHLYVNNNGALGNVIWSIKKNQSVIVPYDAMKDITPMPVIVPETDIDIQPGSELEVNFKNTDAVNNWGMGILLIVQLGVKRNG